VWRGRLDEHIKDQHRGAGVVQMQEVEEAEGKDL
jgi:hypothetical protein